MTKRMISLVLTLAMVLTLFAGLTLTVHADSSTFVSNAHSYSNGESVDGVQIDGGVFYMQFDKNTGNTAPAYYNTGAALRAYGGNKITFTAKSGNITKIEFSFTGTSNAPASGSYSVSAGSMTTGTSATWTGSASEVVITNTATKGHWRMVSVTVTTEGGGGSDAHGSNDCSVEYAQPVAATCTTDGTVGYYYCSNTNCELYGKKYEVQNFDDTTAELTSIVDPKTGHDFADWDDNNDGTCSSTCENGCNTSVTLPHTYVSGVCSHCSANAPAGTTYTAASTLTAGDVIVLVGTNEGVVLMGTAFGEGKLYGTAYTDNGNDTITAVDALELTVVDAGSGYRLMNGSNYLTYDTNIDTRNNLILQSTASDHTIWTWANNRLQATNGGYTYNSKDYNLFLEDYPATVADGEITVKYFTTYGVATTSTPGAAYTLAVYKAPVATVSHDSTHTVEEVSAVAATCTTAGNVAYYKCTEPTCEKYGKYYQEEELTTEIADVTVAALEHNWGEWTVTTAATCTEDGEQQRVCANDATHVETETIAALGHIDENSDGKCDRCGEDMPAFKMAAKTGTYVKQDSLAVTENGSYIFVFYFKASGVCYDLALGNNSTETNYATATVLLSDANDPTDNLPSELVVDSSDTSYVWNVADYNSTEGTFKLYGPNGTLTSTGAKNQTNISETESYTWKIDGTKLATSDDLTFSTTGGYVYASNNSRFALSATATGGNKLVAVYKLSTPATRNIPVGFGLAANADIGVTLTFDDVVSDDKIYLDGNEITLDEGKYTFSVAAKNIDVEHKLTAEDASGNALTVGGEAEKSFNARSYIGAQEENTTVEAGKTASVADVVKNMANYGEAAKKYFTERDGGTYTAVKTYEIAFSDSNSELSTAANATSTKSGNFYGASLLLEDQIKIRFYFTVASADKDKAEFAVTGGTAADKGVKGNYVYVDVPVDAPYLNTAVSVTLTYDGAEAGSVTGYTALRYMGKVIAKESTANANDNLIALCKALFMYYKAANGYFG